MPRQRFIPDTIWHEAGDALRPVHRAQDPDRWLELASGEDSVITQVDDGHPIGPGEMGAVPTSSASRPRMVALMLTHLDVHDADRVLEIGTGTGYHAAVLAHRLGADRVTSIEIDPDVAARARAALDEAGFGGVTTVIANGSHGHPPGAPYDRVIATAACHQVPYAWVAQTRPGGRVVTPWGSQYFNFGLLALTVNGNGTATGQIVDSRGAVIAIGTRVRHCRSSYTQPEADPDGEGVLWLVDHDSDSWARLQHKPGTPGPYPVYQHGPRRLWDEVESAHGWWVEQGQTRRRPLAVHRDTRGPADRADLAGAGVRVRPALDEPLDAVEDSGQSEGESGVAVGGRILAGVERAALERPQQRREALGVQDAGK